MSMRVNDPLVSQGAGVLVAVIVAAASWQQGYQRGIRAYARSRQQAADLAGRIDKASGLVQSSGGPEAWLARHQEDLAKRQGRFPQPDQLPQLLNRLIDAFRTNGLKVVNIVQANLEPLRDGDKPLLVDGRPYSRMPVVVTVEGRYHALLAAIESLTRETFPTLVSVEEVEFRLKESATATLEATIHLSLYLVGTSIAPPPNA